MCTRIKYRRDVACSAARGRVGAHLAASGCMPAHDTHMHTRHRRSARLHYMSTCARTRARYTYATPARPPHIRRTPLPSAQPPHAQLQPARRPRRAASGRRRSPSPGRRRAALAAARGSTAAAAAAAAAELLGSSPTMAAAADKEPVRVERETPMTAPPPAPGEGVGRSVVDVGREQRAGRRARRVGGVPTSAADGTRAQKPWRMVRDDSPSSRTDHPAHAWAVRGLDVTGSEHHDEEKHGRVGGTAGACGTVGSQN